MQTDKLFRAFVIVPLVSILIGSIGFLWFGFDNSLWVTFVLCSLWGLYSDEIIDFLTKCQND